MGPKYQINQIIEFTHRGIQCSGKIKEITLFRRPLQDGITEYGYCVVYRTAVGEYHHAWVLEDLTPA